MSQVSESFAKGCAEIRAALTAFPAASGNTPYRPGGWTRKQVLGHMIDSAANNHQRFIRLQSGDLANFPPYDPDIWVERGAYAENSWTSVVTLWHLYNVQLVHIITGIPAEVLTNRWVDQNVDLAFLVHDYVDHMVGHLKEVA